MRSKQASKQAAQELIKEAAPGDGTIFEGMLEVPEGGQNDPPSMEEMRRSWDDFTGTLPQNPLPEAAAETAPGLIPGVGSAVDAFSEMDVDSTLNIPPEVSTLQSPQAGTSPPNLGEQSAASGGGEASSATDGPMLPWTSAENAPPGLAGGEYGLGGESPELENRDPNVPLALDDNEPAPTPENAGAETNDVAQAGLLSSLPSGVLPAGLGALAGGGLGYLLDDDEEGDESVLLEPALLGALAGGGLGYAGSQMMG